MNHHHHLRPLSAERGMLLRATMALMLLAAPAVATQAQQQEESRSTDLGQGATALKGLDQLAGQTKATLLDKAYAKDADKVSSFSYDDRTKVFFIYNVATGKYLNMGGYWGVHVSLKDYPLPVFTRKFTSDADAVGFIMELSTAQANEMRWVNITSGQPEENQGVYCDRGSDASSSVDGYKGWFLEPVGGDDNQNTYRICTYANGTKTGDKLYLSANIDNEDTDDAVLDADKNCGAATQARLVEKQLWDKDCLWRVFSLDQLYDLLGRNTDQLTQPLDISYKLECPGFDRGRTDRSSWKTFTWGVRLDEDHATRIGLEECNYQMTLAQASNDEASMLPSTGDNYNDGIFQSSSGTGSYTFPYSGTTEKTFTNQDDYLLQMAKYFCMDVRGTRGYIYQEQYVHHPGTYVIACKGYSNTPEAKLFAGIVTGGTGKYDDLKSEDTFGKMVEGSLRTTTLAQTANMDASEKERLHVEEKNMDYAGKEFYTSYKYTNSVVVQVTEDMLPADGTGCRIRFGVRIGNPNANSTPASGEWTVFDEFRIYYASNSSKDEDLVLDENRTDLDYLRQATTYQNKTLHLAKTFTPNRWNSFVLPVSLSSTQIRTTFGANTRLAKLKRIEGTEIQFETVDLDAYFTTDLEAYVPYIIFPTRVMQADGDAPYTSYVTKKGATALDMTTPIVVQANHYDIAGVTLAIGADNYNDLSRIDNLDRPTLNYQSEDAQLEALGTFVRTFDPAATQYLDATLDNYGQWKYSTSKSTIREGYDNLVGCYFFDHGDMYYSDSKERGLRGFSCWFKPIDNKQQTAQPTVYLDGIGQEGMLTQVGELLIGTDAAAQSAQKRGVYNLMGQRLGDTLEGLPSGLYIVDGVKRMVK